MLGLPPVNERKLLPSCTSGSSEMGRAYSRRNRFVAQVGSNNSQKTPFVQRGGERSE